MPIDNKIILYLQSYWGASANDYKVPPCAGKVTLELWGKASYGQCDIPQFGGVGVANTTATQCSKSLVSVYYRARWYGKTQVSSANLNDSNVFGISCNCGYSYFKINSGGYGSGGVKLPSNLSYYANTCFRIGDVVYPGGFHGRRYVTCSGSIVCGKSYATGYGAIYGGWGGDAGPRGPGGNGASAYTNDNYQTSRTYYPGGGGGANGGTNASTSTAGRSFWNTPSSFGAGGSGGSTTTFYSSTYCNASSVSLGGYGGGKTYVSGCAIAGNANIPSNFNYIYGTLTAYIGTKAPSGTTYKHVFSYPGVYQIYVPIGTTSIQVDVLGGGAGGNVGTSQSAPGFNTQIGTNAGGGGGGYARSTLVRNFTTFGAVIDVQVANQKSAYTCATYKSSKVTIDGVLEAEAYTAFDVRGGGCYTNAGTGWNANYARNGLTRIGGKGGAGYSTNCRGGGGGGASWYGGIGGTGGSALSNRTSGGGGGAASCGAAGSNGSTSASTTAGGIGGASGTGYPSSGGTPGNGVYNNTTIFLFGRNGAGGGGGSTTCVSTRAYFGGKGGQSTYLAAGSVFSFCGYKAAAYSCYGGSSYGYVFGPGGGGGGGYGGGGFGYGGDGGQFGGGAGGGRSGYDTQGGGGLVIVAITVDSELAASSVRFDTSTSHVQVI